MFDPATKSSEYMSIVVTHDCNRNCPFCVDAYRNSGETILMEHVRKHLETARREGVKDILLVGGEPTLHPQIASICIAVKSGGFRGIMTTNYSNPELVRELSKHLDCINISNYGQSTFEELPDLEAEATLHTLIHRRQLASPEHLDRFIDTHSFVDLKFSTLSACNEWSTKNQGVEYLDSLDCEWVVLFNEILGQKYRGAIIKRYDRTINRSSQQSLKGHVDGTVSTSWIRKHT